MKKSTESFPKCVLPKKKPTELETYLSWPMTQYVVPRSGIQTQMRDGMEVLILDWEDTTDYIHSIIFDGVKVKTEPLPQYT